jgi:hypothetical protein
LRAGQTGHADERSVRRLIELRVERIARTLGCRDHVIVAQRLEMRMVQHVGPGIEAGIDTTLPLEVLQRVDGQPVAEIVEDLAGRETPSRCPAQPRPAAVIWARA